MALLSKYLDEGKEDHIMLVIHDNVYMVKMGYLQLKFANTSTVLLWTASHMRFLNWKYCQNAIFIFVQFNHEQHIVSNFVNKKGT